MYRAILFDLYDTVVLFARRVPAAEIGGTRWRTTMGWLTSAVATELPGLDFDQFLHAMTATTADIVRNRPPEYREVPSAERFARALARLGVSEHAAAIAERLSAVHMTHLADATELPPSHLTTLHELRKRYALGLVSNFDHGPTALSVLDRHGLGAMFGSVVVSDPFGRRKPHPTIFQAALNELGVSASEALFVGDTAAEDIGGAHAAGLPAVWINRRNESFPETVAPPTHTISALPDLLTRLRL